NVTEVSMRPHLASLGIDDPSTYFNAGVLLVDLAGWREEQASAALLRFVTTRAEPLPWFDQDALNVVFAGRFHRLHPRWNAMSSLWTWPELAAEVLGPEDHAEARHQPSILHFEGPSLSKPWHFLCEHPWRDVYRSTVARTPWAGVAWEDRTLMTE